MSEILEDVRDERKRSAYLPFLPPSLPPYLGIHLHQPQVLLVLALLPALLGLDGEDGGRSGGGRGQGLGRGRREGGREGRTEERR
jgi:hypothetical protein